MTSVWRSWFVASQEIALFDGQLAVNLQHVHIFGERIEVDYANSAPIRRDKTDHGVIRISDYDRAFMSLNKSMGLIRTHVQDLAQQQLHFAGRRIANTDNDWLAIGPSAGAKIENFQQIGATEIRCRIRRVGDHRQLLCVKKTRRQ